MPSTRVSEYVLTSAAATVERQKALLATAEADAKKATAGHGDHYAYLSGLYQAITAELLYVINRLTQEAQAGLHQQKKADIENDAILALVEGVEKLPDRELARNDKLALALEEGKKVLDANEAEFDQWLKRESA